jgi:hypothetical protein
MEFGDFIYRMEKESVLKTFFFSELPPVQKAGSRGPADGGIAAAA